MERDPLSVANSNPDQSTPVRYVGVVHDNGDYTFYLKKGDPGFKEFNELFEENVRKKKRKPVYSRPARGRIVGVDGKEPSSQKLQPETFVEGRMLVCRCYGKREIAVTLRELDRHIHAADEKQVKIDDSKIRPWDDSQCAFTRVKRDPRYPVPIQNVTKLIGELTLDKSASAGEPTGLLLITGSTNSGKSQLARGLIGRVIRNQVERYRKGDRKRRPHLLTFEDPVEKWLFEEKNVGPTSDLPLKYGLEYTPREKGTDVGSLKEAVDDALRQTPSIFFIGEVREDSDWVEVLRFAATGHLVVATAHAGSLVEAMERIFRAVKADTPAGRGQIAQRILGIVHQMVFNLKEFVPPEDAEKMPDWRLPLPTLWRRTPSGVAALVSDGLSSILPNCPNYKPESEVGTAVQGPSAPIQPVPRGVSHACEGATEETPAERSSEITGGSGEQPADVAGANAPVAEETGQDSISSFGRRWFAAQLLKTVDWQGNEIPQDVANKLHKHFEVEAIRFDLMGS
jgi:hypothetical protein